LKAHGVVLTSVLFLIVITIFSPFYSVSAQSYQLPYWIKHTARYWASGDTTDSEYFSSLQWLIDNNIIVLPKGSTTSASSVGNDVTMGATTLTALFPIRNDIGTQWLIKPVTIMTINQTGFVKGATQEFDFSTGHSNETLVVRILSFDLHGNAQSYYQSRISAIQSAGGYTPIMTSLDAKCYGTQQTTVVHETDRVICIKSNVYIVSTASGTITTSIQDDAINFAKIALDKI
jgi:hypothetical protein